MSEQEHQPPVPPKRRKAPRTKVEGKHQPKQQAEAALPAFPPEPSSLAASAEPPVGEKWGEFPPVERQAELRGRLEAWEQEQDHGNRPGPFAGAGLFAGIIGPFPRGFIPSTEFKLTGADVYWLAALTAGAGNVRAGKRRLDEDPYTHLPSPHLEDTNLREAHLEGAFLVRAHLEGADLNYARLEGADLREARLEGADLSMANLAQVNLMGATFDVTANLTEAHLDATLLVADVLWNGVPLTRVAWRQVPRLGDEAVARQAYESDGKRRKGKGVRLAKFEAAARAYRQLAIALRGQGINKVADRFSYRAQIMERKALWWQLRKREFGALGSYLFSLFLAVLTGYGFRMGRIIIAYLALILTFAGAYYGVGFQHPGDISFWQALIVSVTAFHGRVFTNPFTPNIPDAQVVITAIEAVVGLIIEGVFIAMLTQRFFNR